MIVFVTLCLTTAITGGVVVILMIVGFLGVIALYMYLACGRREHKCIFHVRKNASGDAETNRLNVIAGEEHEVQFDKPVSTIPPVDPACGVQEDSFDPTSIVPTSPSSGSRSYRRLLPTSDMQRGGDGGEITVEEEKDMQDIKHHMQNASSAERYRYSSGQKKLTFPFCSTLFYGRLRMR